MTKYTYNDGIRAYQNGDLTLALEVFSSLYSLEPNSYEILYALARTYFEQLDFKNSKIYYKKLCAIHPYAHQAFFDLSLIYLLKKNYSKGFKLYESRIHMNNFNFCKCANIYPTEGVLLQPEHKILLYSEQGFGDTIQFSRYFNHFKGFKNITFLTQKALIRLLKFNFRHIHFVDDISKFDCSNFDYVIPLLSIPYLYKMSNLTYTCDSYLQECKKIDFKTNKFKIGLCWQGETKNARDKYRSIPFFMFQSILSLDNTKFQFYSLQKDNDITHPQLINLSNHFSDFMETANYIKSLDLVITVDTSIAHLSGALGVKTFLLIPYLPDWRWGIQSQHTKWYSSITIFRQHTKLDWDFPLLKLKCTLAKLYQLKNIAILPEVSLAIAANKNGQFAKARIMFKYLIQLHPKFAELYLGLGVAYFNEKNFNKGLKSFQKALELNDQLYEAYYNIGNIFKINQKSFDAIPYYKKALEINPNFIECLNNLANCYQLQEQFTTASFFYQKTLFLEPNNPTILDNYASLLKDTKKFDQAISMYQKALHLAPNNPNIHSNYGLLLILLGFYEKGWKHYEYRLQRDDFIKFFAKYTNRWNGIEDLSNKTLLLVCEQGFGDNIQFIRYTKIFKQKFPHLTLIVATFEPLVKLFKTVSYIDTVLELNESLPNYDYYIPIMSCPLVFNTTINSIPSEKNIFTLHNVKSKISNKKFKIGIVWAGSKTHNSNANRDVQLASFSPLFELSNCTFYSLQVGDEQKEIKKITQCKIVNLGKKFKNFYDTAIAISNLDIIITIDTSVSHIAGSIGKPTFVLIPNRPGFLWMENIKFSYWYSSMKLFRNINNNWEEVIREIKHEVTKQTQPHRTLLK